MSLLDTLGVLRCNDCGGTLISHQEDLGRHQMDALLEHLRTCPEVEARRKRIRRYLEPGWWAGSYSSIANYDQCPAQYKFELIATSRDQGPEALLGTAVHADAQRSGEGLPANNGDVPIDKWFEFLELQAAVKRHKLPPGLPHYEKEWFIEWMIREGLRAQIRAFVDVVCIDWTNWTVYLIDWKTGKYNNEDVRKKWRTQRLMYALAAVDNVPGLWQVIAWTVHLPSGYIYPNPDGERFGVADVERFRSYLHDKVERIANDEEFRPNTGLHCKICRWAEQCPAAQERLARYELELKIVGGKHTITIPESLAQDPSFIDDLEAANYQLTKLLGDAKKVLKQHKEREDEEQDAA